MASARARQPTWGERMADAAWPDSAQPRSGISRLIRMLDRNRQRATPKLRALQFAARLIPTNMCGRARALLLRLDGAQLGTGTRIYGVLDLHGLSTLR